MQTSESDVKSEEELRDAVIEVLARLRAKEEAAEEVYRLFRFYAATLIARARTEAEEREIIDAISAYETAAKSSP